MSTMLRSSAIVLVLISAPCHAQDIVRVQGELYVAGKTPIDPPANEPKRTHAYMTITGPAALKMYRSMRAPEEADLCVTGNRLKRAGPLACSVTGNGRNATCDFSVNLVQGSLSDGRAC